MAGMSAVQYKIMPLGVEIDLEKIKNDAKEAIVSLSGVFGEAEELPVAFGLKALVVSFAFPEEKEIDELGNLFEKLDGVSSVEMIDYRRAIG